MTLQEALKLSPICWVKYPSGWKLCGTVQYLPDGKEPMSPSMEAVPVKVPG